jgi:hypothetical protein
MVVNQDVPRRTSARFPVPDRGPADRLCASCSRRPNGGGSLRLNPRRAITGDVAHARRWPTRLIDALRIFAAGHLQSVLGAGKLHSLHRRDGTTFKTTLRPPIRFAEPAGSASSSRRRQRARNCGSCGQTECSAQTFAVTGFVASLPSLFASTPGAG